MSMDDNQFNENTQFNPEGQGAASNNGNQPNQYGYQQGNNQQYGYQQGSYPPGGYQQSMGNQQQMVPPNGQYKPDSGMVWAILTTLLCCLPFGIVSIVYASKVDSMWYMGNYIAAMDYAKKAKNWAMWAAITGGVVIILYIIFVIIMGVGAYKYGLWNN